VLQSLKSFYGSREGYLPSTLVQKGTITEWLHGPKIVVTYTSAAGTSATATSSIVKNKDDVTGTMVCKKYWDTTAYFMHPWEAANAYHSLNDNVMAILASAIVQVSGLDGF
jgi:hypothetical protein